MRREIQISFPSSEVCTYKILNCIYVIYNLLAHLIKVFNLQLIVVSCPFTCNKKVINNMYYVPILISEVNWAMTIDTYCSHLCNFYKRALSAPFYICARVRDGRR